MTDDPPFLDAVEAAKRLQVTPRTIRRWAHLGILDARRIGPKFIRVSEASVEELKRKVMA